MVGFLGYGYLFLFLLNLESFHTMISMLNSFFFAIYFLIGVSKKNLRKLYKSLTISANVKVPEELITNSFRSSISVVVWSISQSWIRITFSEQTGFQEKRRQYLGYKSRRAHTVLKLTIFFFTLVPGTYSNCKWIAWTLKSGTQQFIRNAFCISCSAFYSVLFHIIR